MDTNYGLYIIDALRAKAYLPLVGILQVDPGRTPAGSLNWRHSGIVRSNESARYSGRARFPLSVRIQSMMAMSVFEQAIRTVRFRTVSFAGALLLLAGTLACGRDGGSSAAGAAPGGRGGPAMAVPVEMVTLAETPVEQIGEFVGTIKSRRSSTVQPSSAPLVNPGKQRPAKDVRNRRRAAPAAIGGLVGARGPRPTRGCAGKSRARRTAHGRR